MKNKMVEIWIRGRKLCEIEQNNEAFQEFERIVMKAGYAIDEKEEGNKIIKMV